MQIFLNFTILKILIVILFFLLYFRFLYIICIVESTTTEAIEENGLTTENLITYTTPPPITMTTTNTLSITNDTYFPNVSLSTTNTTTQRKTQSTTFEWTKVTLITSGQKESNTSELSSIFQNVVNESGSCNDTDMLFNSSSNSSNWDTSNWTDSPELFDYMTAFFAADLSAVLNSLLLLLLSLAMYANI